MYRLAIKSWMLGKRYVRSIFCWGMFDHRDPKDLWTGTYFIEVYNITSQSALGVSLFLGLSWSIFILFYIFHLNDYLKGTKFFIPSCFGFKRGYGKYLGKITRSCFVEIKSWAYQRILCCVLCLVVLIHQCMSQGGTRGFNSWVWHLLWCLPCGNCSLFITSN